ncbi:MAG: hypothetical protein CMB22_03385, partial [Euryarchaeota archaeon]|nr:hypothetical protein [Euryarchaeota archaeon]
RSATSMLAFFVFCIFIILQIQFREPAVLSFRPMLALIPARCYRSGRCGMDLGTNQLVYLETQKTLH